MPTPVIMPKFEMAQETGKVLQWLKQQNSPVEKGEAILEVETDKVTMEVEAPASGILVGIQAEPGAVVPVGQPIAQIIQPGESWQPATQETRERPAVARRADEVPAAVTPLVGATPVAQRIARTHGIDLQAIVGTGPGGRITREDIEAYLAAQRAQPVPSAGKVRAVPAARRLAREMGVDLATVPGTGPRGRIQSADVRRAAAEPPSVAPVEFPGRPAIGRVVRLTGMRRTIAERMLYSTREAPQFTVSADVDMGRAMDIVEDLRSELESTGGPRVTLTTYLVKACTWALLRNPAMNAALEGDNIVEWAEVNMGVAVAVKDGLIVPVIHKADGLGIEEVAARLEDLSKRARAGQLRSEDVQGGTFTLSNLGMFGVDRFTAILNPPQAGILAVGRVTRQPVVSESDRVEVRPMASLTLTADHRVVDGAIAARFLTSVQQAIEHPGLLLG